jgi:UDP-N-acetylglucosamine--N-acetylmuramyl-(pentapeptide) pyrophosphoryl-undecaprenol N-acetylglucosamine transferase
MALVNKGAALIVKDCEAEEKLLGTAIALAGDPEKIAEIEKNVAPLARLDAAGTIAEEIYKLV